MPCFSMNGMSPRYAAELGVSVAVLGIRAWRSRASCWAGRVLIDKPASSLTKVTASLAKPCPHWQSDGLINKSHGLIDKSDGLTRPVRRGGHDLNRLVQRHTEPRLWPLPSMSISMSMSMSMPKTRLCPPSPARSHDHGLPRQSHKPPGLKGRGACEPDEPATGWLRGGYAA